MKATAGRPPKASSGLVKASGVSSEAKAALITAADRRGVSLGELCGLLLEIASGDVNDLLAQPAIRSRRAASG